MMDAIDRFCGRGRGAVPGPQAEVIMHGASGGQVFGKTAPLAASAENVHHAVDHLACRSMATATSAVVEGATENTVVVQALIDNLLARGLDPTLPRLFIVDGAKALSKAIRNTFGVAAAIQRCQVHKGRNIIERLPQHLHASVKKALRQAWDQDDANKAERLLRNLVRRLEHEEPVSGSIRGGSPSSVSACRTNSGARSLHPSSRTPHGAPGHPVKRWRHAWRSDGPPPACWRPSVASRPRCPSLLSRRAQAGAIETIMKAA